MIRLLIVFVLLVNACSRYDGEDNDPCSNYPYYNTFKGKNLGLLQLNDSSARWVYFDTLQNISFINSNNFRTYFVYSHTDLNQMEQLLNYRDSIGGPPCKFRYKINDYFFVQKQIVNYRSTNLGLAFSYIRRSLLDSISKDSLKSLYGIDIFSLMMNKVEFKFPFNYKITLDNCILHDTLTLGKVTYKDLYESYIDSAMIDTNIVNVTGVYYSKTHGLVGFYLSNKEYWYKD
jgi:hypothetical protein